MSSNHLFIVGNGFDLWHQIPTSYKDFYVQHHHYLASIERYFSSSLQGEGLWSDFEKVLGHFEESILIDENDFTDFSGDDFPTKQLFGLEDAVENFSNDIIKNITLHFTKWVKGINLRGSMKQMRFPDTAKFLSFNYTDTLQQLYNISQEKVFHIHGRAGHASDLIFGHAELVTQATHEEDIYYTQSINNARKVLEALQKPVNQIIKDKLNPWLKGLGDISKITLIGHSLSEIDLPYFSRIVEQFPNARWQCNSFNNRDVSTHRDILLSIGVPKNNLIVRKYVHLAQQYPLKKAVVT